MPDDRRSIPRARLSGVRVTFESATGKVQQAEVTDLSREGLFVASTPPLAVGKRLSLEIQVAGEATAWAALGRIIWVRAASEGDKLPAGMAVKIIDMEESVAAAIDRLIAARERTDPGLGKGDPATPPPEKPRLAMPARERTMLGVGFAAATVPAVPIVSAAPARAATEPGPGRTAAPDRAIPGGPARTPSAPRPLPSREKTIVGVGLGGADADLREPSLAIDLVAKKPASYRPSAGQAGPTPAEPARTDPAESAVDELALAEQALDELILAGPTPAEPAEPAHAAPAEPAYAVPAEPAPAVPAARVAPEAPPLRAMEIREPERAADEAEPSMSQAEASRRRGSGWWLLLAFVVACGGAGYAFRDRVLPLWRVAVTTVLKQIR